MVLVDGLSLGFRVLRVGLAKELESSYHDMSI